MAGVAQAEKQMEASTQEEGKMELEDESGNINKYMDPRPPNPDRSEKMCNHFLKACEENKYGWRWVCPNGNETCLYAHKLPEGYMLESTRRALQEMQREDNEDLQIEYRIEEERK